MIAEKYNIRFWSYVDIKNSDDECWEWKKSKSEGGYGFFGVNGKNVHTHRFAYEFANGEGSAKGKIIRHTCDNPPCCNPFHLIAGTQKDNIDDKISRGRDRYLKGNECSWKKLTEEDVRGIKDALLFESVKSISERYSVHSTTILDIKFGRTWKDVGTNYEYKKNKQDIRTYIKELLGRETLDGVVIHYVDGNRDNKASSNIVICPSHAYHELLRQRKNAYEACGHADWIKCTYCKKYDTPENMYQKQGEAKTRPDETYYRFHKDCQREFQRRTR